MRCFFRSNEFVAIPGEAEALQKIFMTYMMICVMYIDVTAIKGYARCNIYSVRADIVVSVLGGQICNARPGPQRNRRMVELSRVRHTGTN